MKEIYYALAGANAFGVYNDRNKLLQSRKYVKSAKEKSFSTFDEAEEYIYLMSPIPPVCDLPDKLPLNWLIYIKNII